MKILVKDYAKLLGISRQAILLQIKEKRLPKGVYVEKIKNYYILTIDGLPKCIENYIEIFALP